MARLFSLLFKKIIIFVYAYGSGISDVAEFQHHSRYEEPQLN